MIGTDADPMPVPLRGDRRSCPTRPSRSSRSRARSWTARSVARWPGSRSGPVRRQSGPGLRPRRPIEPGCDGQAKDEPARHRLFRLRVAGILLFGIVTGLVAVVLALFAMGGIRSHTRRGVWLAASGFLLGIVDVVVWAVLLVMVVGSGLTTDLLESELPPDLATIQELPPPLQRAMRANVLIERNVGMATSAARRSDRA